jgi:hypothetical protein
MIEEVFTILKIIIKSNLTLNNCIFSTIRTFLEINFGI